MTETIQQYHILNGDALKARFPTSIDGELIVFRECLVDGPVHGKTLKAFYDTRSKFLYDKYGGCSIEEYKTKVVSEFEKIQAIPQNAEINLWFEDDLFCQVNLWFTFHLLSLLDGQYSIFLVRPKIHTQYGFGGLSKTELISVFNHRMPVDNINELPHLWDLYRRESPNLLLEYVENLGNDYTFMIPAIKAHLDRIPSKNSLGRPKESLLKISKMLNTNSFPEIFRAFCKKESIYGFGDLQVKRLWDELNDKM